MAGSGETVSDLVRRLLAGVPGASLFGLVDGAQCLELAWIAKLDYGVEIQSLFEGDSAEYLQDVAPYLVAIDPATRYLEEWGRRWGSNAGVLLAASVPVEDLRRHLRSVFVVKDEAGQYYFFRYYDPRVLRTFLPTCSRDQVTEFFGPVAAWILESDPPAGAVVARAVGGRLDLEQVPVGLGSSESPAVPREA